jgi:hypothetical protein
MAPWWAQSAGPALGLLLLAVLLLPAVRQASEASMTLHMLVQYPAFLCAGALLIGALATGPLKSLQRCNEQGLAGLLFAGLTMLVLMVPRVLDLALVDARIETLKLLALLLSGAALRLSWRRAGTVVQAFFLGNVLPMLAVVGTLYQDAPNRLCNAYLLADQQSLGTALMGVAAGVAALCMSTWLWGAVHRRTVQPHNVSSWSLKVEAAQPPAPVAPNATLQ